MPKRKTLFKRGHYYHIYNRSTIPLLFREHENYIYLLKWLHHYSREFNISVIAYCLMPNHYHFLFRQDGEIGISILMQRLFNRYSKAYNKRYGRTGTLFEARFKAILVEDENYLLHLCRYIHGNPVKAGLVNKLEDWPYSNFLEWVNLRKGKLIDRHFVKKYFATPELYKSFVEDYLQGTEKSPEEVKRLLLDE